MDASIIVSLVTMMQIRDLVGGMFKRFASISGAAMWVLSVTVLIIFVIGLYLAYRRIMLSRGVNMAKVFAKAARIKPPRGYDFLAYVADDDNKKLEKEYYIKLSDKLYISTNITKPSFLYKPDSSDTYLCREGKSAVPCGIAFRRGLLAMVVSPEVPAATELARDSKIISMPEEDMDKLLASLYRLGEKKIGYVSLGPETSVGVMFNIRNLIRSYLRILEEADAMMLHFLNTASKAENIERFMRAAAKMSEARLSWMRWLIPLIFVIGLAAAMIIMFKHPPTATPIPPR